MNKERTTILAGFVIFIAISTGTLIPGINWLHEWDIRLLYYLNAERFRPLDPLWIWISNTTFYIAISIPLAIYLYSRRKDLPDVRTKSYLVMISWAVSVIVLNILKYAINRPRPFTMLEGIEKLSTGGSPSFPSGHTIEAVAIVMTVSLLFRCAIWIKLILWIWVLMVAYSRVCLGVHYPSDVLAAMGLGMLIAGLVVMFAKGLRPGRQGWSPS